MLALILWVAFAPGASWLAKCDHRFGADGVWLSGSIRFPCLSRWPSPAVAGFFLLGLALWLWEGEVFESEPKLMKREESLSQRSFGRESATLPSEKQHAFTSESGQSSDGERSSLEDRSLRLWSSEQKSERGASLWNSESWLKTVPFEQK